MPGCRPAGPAPPAPRAPPCSPALQRCGGGQGDRLTSAVPPPPLLGRYFETFSFLPPLSDGEISKQVDYIVR